MDSLLNGLSIESKNTRIGFPFNILLRHMDGFLTQWDFHRVQEHPNGSSDGEVMTFRSWRSYVVNLDELTELTS